ncbi:MAG: ABC transporter permease [Clostridia bacterium]|nr:ABC transporter permease [Clostridia bacterium]
MTLKKHIIILVVFLLLSATSLSGCLFFADNAINKLPQAGVANFNPLEGSEPINVSYFDKISKRVRTKHYSFTSETEPMMLKGNEVIPTYTTCDYFTILNEPLKGSSFTENDQNDLKRKVVISDTLALKLYFNTDVTGRILELSGDKYIIAGVFEDSKNLIDKFSKDGKERIFIPYTLAEKPEDLPVHTVVYDTTTASAGYIEQMNTPQYHFTSLSEKAKVITTIKHVLYLIIYVVFAIALMYLWYKICSKLLKEIGKNLKKNYFSKSFLSIPFKYVAFVLTALGIPAILVFVFLKSDFSIFIVSKYIPYDNLFDIGYYFEMLCKDAQYMNTLALFGDTYRINLYTSTFSSCLWIGAIFLVFFTITIILLLSLLNKLFKNQ